MNVSGEMPRYRCHKEVHALKIRELVFSVDDPEWAAFYPVDDRYALVEVGMGFVKKHDPKAGGYFVVYEDGYKSFSPAEAFESGYTLI